VESLITQHLNPGCPWWSCSTGDGQEVIEHVRTYPPPPDLRAGAGWGWVQYHSQGFAVFVRSVGFLVRRCGRCSRHHDGRQDECVPHVRTNRVRVSHLHRFAAAD
jgi:hypothetical protein